VRNQLCVFYNVAFYGVSTVSHGEPTSYIKLCNNVLVARAPLIYSRRSWSPCTAVDRIVMVERAGGRANFFRLTIDRYRGMAAAAIRRIYEPLTTGRNHVCAFLVLHAQGRYKPLGVFNMRQTSWPRPFRGGTCFRLLSKYVATWLPTPCLLPENL